MQDFRNLAFFAQCMLRIKRKYPHMNRVYLRKVATRNRLLGLLIYQYRDGKEGNNVGDSHWNLQCEEKKKLKAGFKRASHNHSTGGPFKHDSAEPPSQTPPAIWMSWHLVQSSLLTVTMPNMTQLTILLMKLQSQPSCLWETCWCRMKVK